MKSDSRTNGDVTSMMPLHHIGVGRTIRHTHPHETDKMGLNIVAYRQLKKIDAIIDEDEGALDPVTKEPLEDCFIPFNHPFFTGRAEGLEDGAVYRYADCLDVYEGGYSGYNNWRESLAKLAGYTETVSEHTDGTTENRHDETAFQAQGGPFWELINFSDSEGTLGPVVCKKLAIDFANFQNQADMHEDPDFADIYEDLREAFEIASDNGAVDFC